MTISSPVRVAFAAFAAVAILVGCNTHGLALSAPSQELLATPQELLTTPTGALENAVHADHGRSWMAPAAKKSDLLYISDEGTDDVYVFSYPDGTLVGTLTGFVNPRGECVDKAGDVWIVNLGGSGYSSIVEYAHGGTSQIKTLAITGQYPYGCSVDRTTGNLAVTYFAGSYGSTQGAVAVFEHAKARHRRIYVDPHIYYYVLCDYDNQGNLYVDGFNNGTGTESIFEFAEIPSGSSSFRDITLDQSVEFPGGVQWDGKYVVVGDLDNDVVYQFNISGSQGNKVGSTPLNGGSYVEQFWIQGSNNKVVGPSNGDASVMFWKYPAGGKPTKTITGFKYPFGSVISRAR